MNASQLIDALAEYGARIAVDGDRVRVIHPAGRALPTSLIDAARAHKTELRALARRPMPTTPAPQRAATDGWSAEDWRAFYDERAGIAEFDGGLPLEEAETRAFACCVVEWLNRNPAPSPRGRCAGCGRPQSAGDPLLPIGTETAGHAWLHSRCWSAWYAARQAAAIAALDVRGIRIPLSGAATRLTEDDGAFLDEWATM